MNTTSGASVNVRSGPGTSYAIVGSVADGQKVTITCQKRGETVTGTYGTSNLWDYIGTGYISDTYVYTGSDGQVAPTCS
ncbi:SH3 domain-containing protein [Laceyella tengchongensis]